MRFITELSPPRPRLRHLYSVPLYHQALVVSDLTAAVPKPVLMLKPGDLFELSLIGSHCVETPTITPTGVLDAVLIDL